MAGSLPVGGLPDGITKEVVRHPTSTKVLPPRPGDEVEVHYEVTSRDTSERLDSSRVQGQPFKYTVGRGQVFRGWDLAVQSMRMGERCKFTVAPQFARDSDESLEGGPSSSSSSAGVLLDLELLKCPAREDLFDDGGVIKEASQQRPNGRLASSNDELQISYKVSVEGLGQVVDAPHLAYKLGLGTTGQLNRIIDKALLTMKRGEVATLTLEPSYTPPSLAGAPTAGKRSTVELHFEEIFLCHDMSLGIRDRTVLRKRIKECEDRTQVHDGAEVKVRFLSVIADGEKAHLGVDCTFVAGDGAACDALEASVLGLREGEEAMIRCDSAVPWEGAPFQVPANFSPPLVVHIQVVSAEKVKEKWDLSSTERLERGRRRKETAAGLFKSGRVRLAAQHYEAVADLFKSLDYFALDEREEAAMLRGTANLNRAMCMLRLEDMPTVVSLCTDVLKEDPANGKALYRRAKAQFALKRVDESIQDLERLMEVEPNAEAKQLLREAKKAQKATERQQSNTFAKMCRGLGTLPERVARTEDLVAAPDLAQEYAKFAGHLGLPGPPTAPPSASASSSSAPREAASSSGPAIEEVEEGMEDGAQTPSPVTS